MFAPRGQPGTATGFAERLWSLHPWRFSRLDSAEAGVISSELVADLALSQRLSLSYSMVLKLDICSQSCHSGVRAGKSDRAPHRAHVDVIYFKRKGKFFV